MSAQLEPHGVLPRRRQLLICRKSGEVLQWDVPSLATSLAEGACNALVEKELSKMTPQHQHEEASAIYPPYQHEQHEELGSAPSPSKALGTGDDKQRGASSRRGRLEARETFGAAVRALGAATAAEEHWVDGMEWLRGADNEEEAEAAAEAEDEAQAAQAAQARARARAQAQAEAEAEAEAEAAAAEEQAQQQRRAEE